MNKLIIGAIHGGPIRRNWIRGRYSETRGIANLIRTPVTRTLRTVNSRLCFFSKRQRHTSSYFRSSGKNAAEEEVSRYYAAYPLCLCCGRTRQPYPSPQSVCRIGLYLTNFRRGGDLDFTYPKLGGDIAEHRRFNDGKSCTLNIVVQGAMLAKIVNNVYVRKTPRA